MLSPSLLSPLCHPPHLHPFVLFVISCLLYSLYYSFVLHRTKVAAVKLGAQRRITWLIHSRSVTNLSRNPSQTLYRTNGQPGLAGERFTNSVFTALINEQTCSSCLVELYSYDPAFADFDWCESSCEIGGADTVDES